MALESSLTNRFALIGAGTFVLAAVLLSYVGWTMAVGNVIAMGQDYNVSLATTLSNVVNHRFAAFLRTAGRLTPDELRAAPENAELRHEIVRLTRGSRMVKTKIYNSEGLTTLSTDVRQIGESQSGNGRFQTAMTGKVVSELTFRHSIDSFEGEVSDRDLLSSYLPIRGTGDDAPVIGVFELYTDVTEFKARVERAAMISFAVLILAFAAIYFLLVCVVGVGNRRLARKHQDNLALAESALRAEAASQAKSVFLANMSHELRTPLNAIIGFSDVITGETFGPVQPGRYRSYAENIHAAGVRLLGVIDDVLELVNLETSPGPLPLDETDIGEVIGEAERRTRPKAAAAYISMESVLPDSLPRLRCDRRLVEKILDHVLSNAVKFTPSGGRVSLRVVWDKAGDSLLISVADTGIGIAEEDIPLVLSPFGRLASPELSKYPGAGLGLSLSHRLARVLGGELTIESHPGQGTTVTLVLSLACPKVEGTAELYAA